MRLPYVARTLLSAFYSPNESFRQCEIYKSLLHSTMSTATATPRPGHNPCGADASPAQAGHRYAEAAWSIDAQPLLRDAAHGSSFPPVVILQSGEGRVSLPKIPGRERTFQGSKMDQSRTKSGSWFSANSFALRIFMYKSLATRILPACPAAIG